MLICLLIRGFDKQILYLIMADLKMVTVEEILNSGYTASITMDDSFCPTKNDFETLFSKSGYSIEVSEIEVGQIDDDQLFSTIDEYIYPYWGLTGYTSSKILNPGDSLSTRINDDDGGGFSVKVPSWINCNGLGYGTTYNENNGPGDYSCTFTVTGSASSNLDGELELIARDGNVVSTLSIELQNKTKPTWNMPESIDIDKTGWHTGDGIGPYELIITDNDNVGWRIESPEFIDLNGSDNSVFEDYKNGDFVTTLTGKGSTTFGITSASYDENKAGTMYLKSLDGNETYNTCSLAQKAFVMKIYFNGMNSDFKNKDNPRLFIWDISGEYFFELGNDFDPSIDSRQVTLTKDLYDKIVRSSYNNAPTEYGWEIGCTNVKGDLSYENVDVFNIMANNVAGSDVLDTIVTAWQNGDDSVNITVSYTETSFTLPSWDLTTGATLGLSDTSHTITFTVTDEDEMGYIFSATNATSFLYLIDPNNGPYDWGTKTGGTKQWRLDIENNTGSYRYGNVYLMGQDKSIIDSVKVQQNAYVDTSLGELYSIRSNGSNNPIKLRASDVSRTEITSNDITVEVEWAPQTVIGDNSGIYPIFGWSSQSETYIYAEYVPDNLNYNYRIHVVSAGVDISGCTFLATNTSSEKLVQITHSILNAGTYHKVVVAYPNSNGYYNAVDDSSDNSVIPSYYSIYVGGIQNYQGEVKGVSYFGSVLLTIGSNKTNWVPFTTNGTTVGWVQKTSSGDIESNTFVTASNYSIGKRK